MQEPAPVSVCSSAVPITAVPSIMVSAITSIATGTSVIASGSGGAVPHLGHVTRQSTGQGKSSQGASADVQCVRIKHTDLASHPPDTMVAATAPTMMTPATPAPVTTPTVMDPVVTVAIPAPPPIALVTAATQCLPIVSHVAHTAHYYQQQKLWLHELDYDNIPDGIKNLSL